MQIKKTSITKFLQNTNRNKIKNFNFSKNRIKLFILLFITAKTTLIKFFIYKKKY